MNRQQSFKNDKATLYLVATPIGNLGEITYRAVEILNSVDYIAAEDTRNTIKLLNHLNISKKLLSHHEHNIKSSTEKIIAYLKDNKNIALVSDAGYPAISDPGYELVQEVIKENFNVVPISGANAGLNALVVSGICPQPFMFYGFLDHTDKKKKQELESLEGYKETLVFYESPHRIKKTLELMLDKFGDRNIALCRELTKRYEEILRGTVSEILNVVDELKGEMVIIVEGNKTIKSKTITEEEILAKIEEYISKGMSKKDAINEVAKQTKVSKNKVYKIYHN